MFRPVFDIIAREIPIAQVGQVRSAAAALCAWRALNDDPYNDGIQACADFIRALPGMHWDSAADQLLALKRASGVRP